MGGGEYLNEVQQEQAFPIEAHLFTETQKEIDEQLAKEVKGSPMMAGIGIGMLIIVVVCFVLPKVFMRWVRK